MQSSLPRQLNTVLEPELLRGVALHDTIGCCGSALQAPDTGMFRVDPRNYARSYPTQRYDAFLSHEWQSSQFAKFLSLLIIFNSRAAAVASLVVSIAQGLYWSLSEVPRVVLERINC